MAEYVLAIDQGTTGTTILLLNRELTVVARVNREFPQHYPKPGWVEHDPEDIWGSTVSAMGEALKEAGITGSDIACIGITNQRETTTIWRRKDSGAIHKAIVWQCRRTADRCAAFKERGVEPEVSRRSGLLLDPYFSGTKIGWLLDNVDGARTAAEEGALAFGTVDTYLVWRLTSGKAHVTDVSNASRTLLMNLETLAWDDELLNVFKIPRPILPEIRSSSEVYGETRNVPGLPDGIPIAGMAGDQQAALFGQACFERGSAKCTYGTGAFLLYNTGSRPVVSEHRLLTTVAWTIKGKTTYALEGSAFIAGAVVQWLRDGLGLIGTSPEVEALAASVPDTGDLIVVPALTGLGAPRWRADARGLITGITRDTTAAHLARAALNGVAFQIYEIVKAMQKDSGADLSVLKVDGGASVNNVLMQFQSDLLGSEIVRPSLLETTALGSAFLAGLAVGIWSDLSAIENTWKEDQRYRPAMADEEVQRHLALWNAAVEKA